MQFDSGTPWFTTDSKLFKNGEDIGLTPGEYLSWADPDFYVLEVGTGTSASALRTLLNDNVNVIGIEPGLNYMRNGYKYTELKTDPQLANLIAPLNAVDAIDHPLMPSVGVDVIFAQNSNFAQYAITKADFFNQLYGLVRCLRKDKKDSYVTFESLHDNCIFYTRGSNPESIDLSQVLNDVHARWTTRENKSGLTYIIIYRTNDEGRDISAELAQYITA